TRRNTPPWPYRRGSVTTPYSSYVLIAPRWRVRITDSPVPGRPTLRSILLRSRETVSWTLFSGGVWAAGRADGGQQSARPPLPPFPGLVGGANRPPPPPPPRGGHPRAPPPPPPARAPPHREPPRPRRPPPPPPPAPPHLVRRPLQRRQQHGPALVPARRLV